MIYKDIEITPVEISYELRTLHHLKYLSLYALDARYLNCSRLCENSLYSSGNRFSGSLRYGASSSLALLQLIPISSRSAGSNGDTFSDCRHSAPQMSRCKSALDESISARPPNDTPDRRKVFLPDSHRIAQNQKYHQAYGEDMVYGRISTFILLKL